MKEVNDNKQMQSHCWCCTYVALSTNERATNTQIPCLIYTSDKNGRNDTNIHTPTMPHSLQIPLNTDQYSGEVQATNEHFKQQQ